MRYWFSLDVEIHKVITVITMNRFDFCFTCLITAMLPTRRKSIVKIDDASDCFLFLSFFFSDVILNDEIRYKIASNQK